MAPHCLPFFLGKHVECGMACPAKPLWSHLNASMVRRAQCQCGVQGVPLVTAQCQSGVQGVLLVTAQCQCGVQGVPLVTAQCQSGVQRVSAWP